MKVLAALLLSIALPVRAQPPCQLCAPAAKSDVAPGATTIPLAIVVESGLDFSRAAVASDGGSIAIDGVTGTRSVSGLRDLGGIAMRGVVRLTGQPNARVRVTLPARIDLRTGEGAIAQVVDLASDLAADPRLDATGSLLFNFGGRLMIPPGAAGDLRGRVLIAAEYD